MCFGIDGEELEQLVNIKELLSATARRQLPSSKRFTEARLDNFGRIRIISRRSQRNTGISNSILLNFKYF
jgi:hypothetical protein